MLEGLEIALKILNRRLDYIKRSNDVAEKSGDPFQNACKYSEAYIYAFEEMKIYLDTSISRVKNGENPESSTSIVMEGDK